MSKKNYLDEAREKDYAWINQYCIRFIPCAILYLASSFRADFSEKLEHGAIIVGFFLTVELSYYGLNRDGYIASISSWLAWAAFGYLWYVGQFSNMLMAAAVPGVVLFIAMQPFVFFRRKQERDRGQ